MGGRGAENRTNCIGTFGGAKIKASSSTFFPLSRGDSVPGSLPIPHRPLPLLLNQIMPPGPSALVHPYPLPVSVQLSFLSPFLLDLCPLVEIASIRGRREKILAMPHLSHQQAIINNCNIHFFSSLISFQNPAPTYGKRIPFVFMGGLGLHCRRRTIHPRSPSPHLPPVRKY